MKRREHESTGELGRRATYLCTYSSSCERARPHDTYVVYMHVHVEPLPGLAPTQAKLLGLGSPGKGSTCTRTLCSQFLMPAIALGLQSRDPCLA